MRYKEGHKEASKSEILSAASRRFKRDGIAATGIARVMTDAGLTNGAFYAHFGSKDNLIRETMDAALDEQRERYVGAVHDQADLEAAIRDYLSPRHRDNPAFGCPTSVLAPELSRQPRRTRKSYTEKLTKLLDLLSKHVPAVDADEARRRTAVVMGNLVGALQMSRAITDVEMSDRLLADAADAAIAYVRREAP